MKYYLLAAFCLSVSILFTTICPLVQARQELVHMLCTYTRMSLYALSGVYQGKHMIREIYEH